MRPVRVRVPDGRVWLRLAEPEWRDPLDPSHAREAGGRWNPPGSYRALYLNADVATARMQIERLLDGSSVRLDDLADDAYVLVAAVLPRQQRVADATTTAGLRALGLPASYPRTAGGGLVGHDVCQPVGAEIRRAQLRGVWCRSACTSDGHGRELAWFPGTVRSSARAIWQTPLPLGGWRDAARWGDIGLDEQADPAP